MREKKKADAQLSNERGKLFLAGLSGEAKIAHSSPETIAKTWRKSKFKRKSK